jgi:hypothetical protein
LNLHQGDEPVHFGFPAEKLRDNASEPQGVLAERRPHPILAARGGITFVENEINHLEHRGDARGALLGARRLERHAGLGERSLGAHDPLRDGRFGHQECAGDLRGTEASQEAQGERRARLGGQYRMTRDEHQPHQIVADVTRLGRILARRADERRLVGDRLMAALEELAPPQLIERAVLRSRHQPRARVVGDSGRGPSLERAQECLLRELLGEPDLRQHAREARDDLGRFHAPHRLDRALNGRLGHHGRPRRIT